MTIAENLNRLMQAKEDLREAINVKGGELAEDARLEEFASAVENLPSDNPYAVNFGKEIVENNTYYMNSLQEDIDYYNEVVNAVKSGEKKESDYMNTGDFKKRIAWIPTGWAKPTGLNKYERLLVLDKPEWAFTVKNALQNNYALEYCRVSLAGCTDASGMFSLCVSLRDCIVTNTESITNASTLFSNCASLVEISVNLPNVTTMTHIFGACYSLKKATITNVHNCTQFANIFLSDTGLEEVRITGWKQGGLPIKNSENLTVNSIAHLIDNSVALNDGATARTLSLHTTALKQWTSAVKNATVYTREDGTTITCAELADIAANVKGITIA